MIAACPQCSARYRIERERLPAHGARVRCSRCETIFRVSPPQPKPVPEPEPEPVPVATGAVPDAARPKRLVLVADPDIEAGKALVGAMAGWGVEPVLVHDGVEAILTVQRTLPSLVVLEASLPKMFGFQVCELMKRNEQLRAIPVVLVGAIHHRERYRRQAAETYGADAYLERPGLTDSLRAILRERGILPEELPSREPLAREVRPGSVPVEAPVPAAPSRPVASPAPEPVAAPRVPSLAEAPRMAEAAAAAVRRAQVPPAPAPEPDVAADVTRAERLARIIVSDIVLYNPERFESAIRSGDVLEAMATEMEEGRAHFRERIPERIRERRDFLGEELVRVARLRGMT